MVGTLRIQLEITQRLQAHSIRHVHLSQRFLCHRKHTLLIIRSMRLSHTLARAMVAQKLEPGNIATQPIMDLLGLAGLHLAPYQTHLAHLLFHYLPQRPCFCRLDLIPRMVARAKRSKFLLLPKQLTPHRTSQTLLTRIIAAQRLRFPAIIRYLFRANHSQKLPSQRQIKPRRMMERQSLVIRPV